MTLYLKYRPKTWDEVVGQDHITITLMNAIRRDEVAHALLFCGKHGTGKTTVGRIFAREIGAVGSDIVEIDAASNRGIDDARRLKEDTYFVPINGPVKVFIIDECHMLTKEANNALLKTLEEPPPRVFFVLCTTNPGKLLPTVLSRCQRHNFKSIGQDIIKTQIENICAQEKLLYDDKALDLIASQANGSMRDAISMLDLFSNYGYIYFEKVRDALGLADNQLVRKMVDSLAVEDLGKCLDVVNEVWLSGNALPEYCRQMVEYFRGLLLARAGRPDPMLSVDVNDADRFSMAGIMQAIETWNKAARDVHKCSKPQIELECAAVQCLDFGISCETGDF